MSVHKRWPPTRYNDIQNMKKERYIEKYKIYLYSFKLNYEDLPCSLIKKKEKLNGTSLNRSTDSLGRRNTQPIISTTAIGVKDIIIIRGRHPRFSEIHNISSWLFSAPVRSRSSDHFIRHLFCSNANCWCVVRVI